MFFLLSIDVKRPKVALCVSVVFGKRNATSEQASLIDVKETQQNLTIAEDRFCVVAILVPNFLML